MNCQNKNLKNMNKNTKRFETWLIVALVILLITCLAIISDAKPTPYWRVRHKSNGEAYTYSKPDWGAGSNCAGMYNHQPIKDRNLKRYHFYRHPKTHGAPKRHRTNR